MDILQQILSGEQKAPQSYTYGSMGPANMGGLMPSGYMQGTAGHMQSTAGYKKPRGNSEMREYALKKLIDRSLGQEDTLRNALNKIRSRAEDMAQEEAKEQFLQGEERVQYIQQRADELTRWMIENRQLPQQSRRTSAPKRTEPSWGMPGGIGGSITVEESTEDYNKRRGLSPEKRVEISKEKTPDNQWVYAVYDNSKKHGLDNPRITEFNSREEAEEYVADEFGEPKETQGRKKGEIYTIPKEYGRGQIKRVPRVDQAGEPIMEDNQPVYDVLIKGFRKGGEKGKEVKDWVPRGTMVGDDPKSFKKIMSEMGGAPTKARPRRGPQREPQSEPKKKKADLQKIRDSLKEDSLVGAMGRPDLLGPQRYAAQKILETLQKEGPDSAAQILKDLGSTAKDMFMDAPWNAMRGLMPPVPGQIKRPPEEQPLQEAMKNLSTNKEEDQLSALMKILESIGGGVKTGSDWLSDYVLGK